MPGIELGVTSTCSLQMNRKDKRTPFPSAQGPPRGAFCLPDAAVCGEAELASSLTGVVWSWAAPHSPELFTDEERVQACGSAQPCRASEPGYGPPRLDGGVTE